MKVVFVLVRGVNLLDLAGPAQVFSAAAVHGAEYELEYVGEHASILSAQGLAFSSLGELDAVDPDTLIVVPGPDLSGIADPEQLMRPELLRWLRDAHDRGCQVASVCTGALVLGEAGLLDGRRCTSHWGVIDVMRERYPTARVDDRVLFVHDGRVSTSAGIASGIDLALSLVERRHGPAFAAKVARELVVYVRRNGDASPVSPFLAYRDHTSVTVHRVQDLLVDDLAGAHSLGSLASAVHLSPRGLSRSFAAATGVPPMRYLAELRLAQAETLLRATALSIERIGVLCGYPEPRNFRRAFHARFRRSPSAYRVHAEA